jgi:hypothetical protein
MKEKFNNRLFKLWGYTVSHGYLLIRSEKQYPDVVYPLKYDPNFTIDIEFWGVAHMNIPTRFEGLTIRKKDSNNVERMKMLSVDKDMKCFSLSDGKNEYYVIAAGCIIGASNWGLESRFTDPNLQYDKIIAQL